MNKIFKFTILLLMLIAFLTLIVKFVNSHSIAVLDPKGLIGLKERELIIISTLLMLIVVLPVFFLTIFISWKYREGNSKAKYTPNWDYNFVLEFIWWGLPCLIILALSVITWKSSYDLDPFKALDSQAKPLKIQVVALQWKWLFIYPEHDIATVNFIQFPKDTPINFEVTATAPMNSFWIPQLGGQIYAMPGMKTKLHLIANAEGDFRGSSANLSGEGFAGMTFIAKASSQDDFDHWLQSVKESTKVLNQEEYRQLVLPSEYHPVVVYVLKEKKLFEQIVMQYMPSHN